MVVNMLEFGIGPVFVLIAFQITNNADEDVL